MKAVYAGSFDPFTNGHMDIVKKASKLFDELYVVISYNSEKTRNYDVVFSAISIEEAIKAEGITNVHVHYWKGLIVDFCKAHDVQYLIRGLRTPIDFSYEENIANINKELSPEIETIYLRADNATISSSMVRELLKYNKPVDKYVPKTILYLINKEREKQS